MPRSKKPRELIANRLLAALSQKEYQRLQPQLEQVTLVFGDILYEPGDVIDYVYFVNQGIVSLLSIVEGRSPLEVGMVGSEGMVGIGVFLGARTSLNRALVQGAGTALRMKAGALLQELKQQGALSELLRRYTHSLLAQVSQGAVAPALLPCSIRWHCDAKKTVGDLNNFIQTAPAPGKIESAFDPLIIHFRDYGFTFFSAPKASCFSIH